MRKLISSINITLDGFCDHTAVIADDELHQNANELLRGVDTVLFGRVTYQLMESGWPPIVKKPTGIKSIDDFAILIDNIAKIVFSNTLKNVEWKNTKLAKVDIKEEVVKLKQQPGKNILVGSPGIIITLMQLGLIDEYQFCVQPIILGSGLPLFKNIKDRIDLILLKTRTLGSGAIILYYKPMKNLEQNIPGF
jgi:dihydrofolate reductase